MPESGTRRQNVGKERRCFKAGNAVSRLKQGVWRRARKKRGRMETGTEKEKRDVTEQGQAGQAGEKK